MESNNDELNGLEMDPNGTEDKVRADSEIGLNCNETSEVPINQSETNPNFGSTSVVDNDSAVNSDECNVDQSGDDSSGGKSGDEKADNKSQTLDESEPQKETKDCDSVVSKKLRYQYSKNELIAISKLPSSQLRAKCLDKLFNNEKNLWDPEKWMNSKNPNNGSSNASAKYGYNKRERQTDGNESLSKRTNITDPRERVVDEDKDNIILSPQRGSFGTGCHVSTAAFVTNKTGDTRVRDYQQERAKNDESNDGSQRTNANHRRVGTGRIVSAKERSSDWNDRSYDRNDRNYDRDRNFDNRIDSRDNRNEEYIDRRKGRYPYDNSRRPYGSYKQNRYESRDHYRHVKEEEEPEWFSGGPTSKHETIELKGFDDEAEDVKDVKGVNNDGKSCENLQQSGKNWKDSDDWSPSESAHKANENREKSDEFNINNMFKSIDWLISNVEDSPDNKLISSMDVISNTATNDCDNTKSRFTQWFSESPTNAQTGHFDDNSQNVGNATNALKDKYFNSSNTEKRSNSENRSMLSNHQNFGSHTIESNAGKSLLDLLQGSNRKFSLDQIETRGLKSIDPSKIQNLSEIEASLNQLDISNNKQQHQENDKVVFEKIITELGKRSTNPVVYDRHNNYDKRSQAIILPTTSHNIIIPKEQQRMITAPSIMELLNEAENQATRDSPESQSKYSRHVHNSAYNPINCNSPQMFAKSSASFGSFSNIIVEPWNTTQMSQNTDYTENALRNSQFIQKSIDKDQAFRDNACNANPTPTRHSSLTSNPKLSFTPTCVIRKMHSEKDRDSIGKALDDICVLPEVQTSHQKYVSEQLTSAKSPRPIIKSNNLFSTQSPSLQQQVKSPNVSLMNTNIEAQLNKYHIDQQQQHLNLQQLMHNSHQSTNSNRQMNNQMMINPRSIGSPLNLGPNIGHNIRPSTPSPNSNIMQTNASNLNSMAMNNYRSNVMPPYHIQPQRHSVAIESRQLQYSLSNARLPIDVQNMLKTPNNANNQRSGNPYKTISSSAVTGQQFTQSISQSENFLFPFNNSNERTITSDESITCVPSTYQQLRPQLLLNSGDSRQRNLGQWFGNDMLAQKLPDMPPVPFQDALTLDDIERQ